MLKSATSCEPGQQPVIMLVQPGGVSVGSTPSISRWQPVSISRPRFGACPRSTMCLTISMLAPSSPITIARRAGLLVISLPPVAEVMRDESCVMRRSRSSRMTHHASPVIP
jgi:hypothetical protein